MRILLLVAVVTSFSGCAFAPMGKMTRYDDHGQQTICWEPSRKMNGLATFIANRLEARGRKVDGN